MLSIILLNFNNTYHTKKCLISLEKQTYKDFEIILVDNKSNEFYRKELVDFLESNQLIESILEKIKLIKSDDRMLYLNEVNLGFTGGSNLGIRKSQGDLILLLNNDTLQEPTFLEIMVSFFKKFRNLHLAQPKICCYPDKKIIWGMGGVVNKFSYNLFKMINSGKLDFDLENKPFKIDYAIGTALFVRREILKKIGLLDNIFFMYCEESDLCFRAMKQGYKNIYCNPKAVIFHNRKPGLSKKSKELRFRNRTIFCIKHFSIAIIIWQFFMQFIELLLLIIDFNKMKIDYKFFSISIRGMLNGLKLGIRRRLSIH